MNRTLIGWTWVAGQVVLLGTLVLLGGRQDWATPSWLVLIAGVLFFGGLALVGFAALGLGSALTPTPVPTERGTLTTDGLYRFMRHPIYTGVLAIVAGMTLRSGSFVHLAVAIATFAFFDRKAAWEEAQLRQEYAGYSDYSKVTNRFIPKLR